MHTNFCKMYLFKDYSFDLKYLALPSVSCILQSCDPFHFSLTLHLLLFTLYAILSIAYPFGIHAPAGVAWFMRFLYWTVIVWRAVMMFVVGFVVVERTNEMLLTCVSIFRCWWWYVHTYEDYKYLIYTIRI